MLVCLERTSAELREQRQIRMARALKAQGMVRVDVCLGFMGAPLRGGSWFFVSRCAAVHSLFKPFGLGGLGELEVDVFEVHDVAFGGCFWHEA